MNRIEKFQVIDESGDIHGAAKITPVHQERGSNDKRTGLPSYRLSTGEHLNTKDGENFEAIFSSATYVVTVVIWTQRHMLKSNQV